MSDIAAEPAEQPPMTESKKAVVDRAKRAHATTVRVKKMKKALKVPFGNFFGITATSALINDTINKEKLVCGSLRSSSKKLRATAKTRRAIQACSELYLYKVLVAADNMVEVIRSKGNKRQVTITPQMIECVMETVA